MENLTSYMTFSVHKLVRSEPFLDSRCEIWQLLPTLYSEVWAKILYRCTSTFLALKYAIDFFLKYLKILWCAQTFPPIFELFTIYDRNFPKIVASPSNRYANYLVHLKGWSLPKKTVKVESKSTHKLRTRCLFKQFAPRTKSAPDTKRDREKKNKHHIFATTAGARCTIFPKLCMMIELVENIKKVPVIFLMQRIVFPTWCTETFGLIDRRAVSQQ